MGLRRLDGPHAVPVDMKTDEEKVLLNIFHFPLCKARLHRYKSPSVPVNSETANRP